MIEDSKLLAMTKEELFKLPQEVWKERFLTVLKPKKAKSPQLFCEDPKKLPCSGEWITVKNRNGDELPVIIYVPDSDEEKIPVYFHLHGGGYNAGYPEMNEYECSYYAKKADCLVVSVGYRLAPEYPFPAGIEDCYDVIRYFVQHAQEYGIDTERMGVGGESAGGGLASAMCILAARRKEFKFSLQMLVCPGVNNHDIPGEGEAFIYHATNVLSYCTYEQTSDPLVSPVFTSDEELAQMPPTVIVTAQLDDWCIPDENYGSRMVKNGVPVHIRRFPGVRHCFNLHWPDYWNEEQGVQARAFLADELKRHFWSE